MESYSTPVSAAYSSISSRSKNGVLTPLAVTVGFVAFANYGNQVALLRVVNGVMQGIQPVGNFHILGVRVALGHAGFDVRDNIFHFFQSGCCLRSGC